MSRREFIFFGVAAGAVAAGAAAVPIGLVLMEDDDGTRSTALMYPRLRVGSLADLQVGEPVMFDYPLEGQSNMLVKIGREATLGIGPDRDIVAFSNICTHMGCPITTFQSDLGVLGPCPCHYTTFDFARDGQVTLGQATQSLPRVALDIDGDDIVAIGLERLVYGHHDSLRGAAMVSA